MSYAQNTLLNKKLPSYAGFFVLLAALGITLLLSGNTFLFISKATVSSTPKNIQISNLSDTSFTISYTTDAPSVGTISYGTAPSTQNIALDDRDQQASGSTQYQVHFITVKNLTPSTTYYYVIDSGSQKVENNGSPFQITTDPTLANPPSSGTTLSGTVAQSDGSIPKEGIVYVTTQDAQQLATLINPDGSYQIALDSLRDSGGTTNASLTPTTILQIQAVTPTQESMVKLLASQASHVPKIVLSQNYDFTLGPIPAASGSGQTIVGPAFPALATPQPVSSPEITTPTDKQTFSDQQPLFQGRALANKEIDLTIKSQEEISTKLQSDNTGTWQFRSPIKLAPGTHTITIKSIDASGIIQTITRSFVVYASGSQFIEPSVSPVASASPTLAPTPTLAATPTKMPTPTVSPTAIPTPTVAQKVTTVPAKTPLPKTGSSVLIYGILGAASTMGIGALLFFVL